VLQAYHQELATILLNYHIGRIVLGSMCVGVSVWLGWSGIRVAGLSSGACDLSIVSSHWLCVLVSMCVGVSVWLGWSGIRVPHQNSNAHRNKNTTNVVMQQKIRRLLIMDVLMSETCGA